MWLCRIWFCSYDKWVDSSVTYGVHDKVTVQQRYCVRCNKKKVRYFL